MVKELPLPTEADSDRKTSGGFTIFLETAYFGAKAFEYTIAVLGQRRRDCSRNTTGPGPKIVLDN